MRICTGLQYSNLSTMSQDGTARHNWINCLKTKVVQHFLLKEKYLKTVLKDYGFKLDCS